MHLEMYLVPVYDNPGMAVPDRDVVESVGLDGGPRSQTHHLVTSEW